KQVEVGPEVVCWFAFKGRHREPVLDQEGVEVDQLVRVRRQGSGGEVGLVRPPPAAAAASKQLVVPFSQRALPDPEIQLAWKADFGKLLRDLRAPRRRGHPL